MRVLKVISTLVRCEVLVATNMNDYILHHVVWHIVIDVFEELNASTIMVVHHTLPDDGGSKLFRNVR
jgi:hypothetical protein